MHTVSRTELKSDERVLVKGLLLFFVKVQLINEAYNLVVDAVLGPETEPLSVGEPFTGVLQTLRGLKVPIVSLDIPSGTRPHPVMNTRDEARVELSVSQ